MREVEGGGDLALFPHPLIPSLHLPLPSGEFEGWPSMRCGGFPNFFQDDLFNYPQGFILIFVQGYALQLHCFQRAKRNDNSGFHGFTFSDRVIFPGLLILFLLS